MGHICPFMTFLNYIVAIALDLIVLHSKQFSIRKGNNIRWFFGMPSFFAGVKGGGGGGGDLPI